MVLKRSEWLVQPISLMTARHLIENYHYAKSGSNTAVYTHGLFRKGEEFWEANCLGVAWWLPPTRAAAEATFTGDWQKVLSLSRLVVAPSVPKNGASFLMMGSIRMIDKKAWGCLVTYADTWRGHTGAIYKATNWEYMGLTEPSEVFVKKGKMMGRKRGPRTFTKAEMKQRGFESAGLHQKHKFRMIL